MTPGRQQRQAVRAQVADVRRARLIEAMRDDGIDVVVLFGNAWQNDYLRYGADFGIREGEGVAVISRDGETTLYLDDRLEAERCAVECPGLTTRVSQNAVAQVADLVGRLGNHVVAVGPKRNLPQGLAGLAAQSQARDATAMLDRLLMVKAAEELDAVRRAAALADKGYDVFRRAARVGRKDYELIAEIEAFYRARGVDDNFMIIGVGGPEVRGMAPPMGKVLRPGDMVTTELTPCVDGYYVQICRTLVLGQPTAAQNRAFGIYLEAMVAGIEVVAPGVTAADIARAENDVFRKYGLGEYVTSEYTRVRGHGLGLFPDTKPHILEDVPTPIEAGMSLIVHPNTYNPDVGYLVLGDSLIVGPSGAEVLTRTPRELFSVDAGAGGAA
jgi:Xaa-Pro dipeptidase